MPQMKLMIACGGTGGHIYPALAVAQEFEPGEICFVGSNQRLEQSLIERAGFQFEAITVSRKNPFLILKGVQQALSLIRKHRPGIIFSTGGYVSFPVVMAAVLLRKPIVLQEQNKIPGKVNRFLSRFAKKTLIAFKDSMDYFPKPHTTYLLGNPIRKELYPVEKKQHSVPTILIMGGSQGAQAIDESVKPLMEIHAQWKWIHLHSKNYVHQMNEVYAQADLVVSRAGALSLAEIALWQIPAVLIPYPYAADNHQNQNAKVYEKQGAAVVIDQKELTSQKLLEIIQKLIESPQKLSQMSQKMLLLSYPKSRENIANFLRQIIDE